MATLQNTFEGGTPPNAVTTGNSGGASGNAFDLVDPSSSTITYTADALHGSVACQVAAATSDDPYFEWQSGIVGTTTWGRVYIKFSANPGSNTNIVRHLAGTQIVITVRVNTTGRLGLLYGSGTFASNGTVAIPLNTWVRLEWSVTTGTSGGAVTAWLYTDPESATPADTLQATGVNVGTAAAVTRQRMGLLSSATWTVLFDSVAFSDSAKIGPVGGGGPIAAAAADTLTLADTATRGTSTKVRAGADALTVTDAAARALGSSRTGADSVSFSDGAVAVVTRARTAADLLTVVDTATRATAAARASADTLGLGDAASPTTGQHVTASDTLVLADAAGRSLTLARVGDDRQIPGDGTNADHLNLNDAATRITTAARAAADVLTVAEETAATSGQIVAASDALTLSDAAVGVLTVGRAGADGLALGDAAVGATGQTATATDALALGDSAGRVAALARATSDGVALADVASRTLTAERAVTGTLTLVDVAAASGGEPDAGRGTPTLTGYPAATLADRPDAGVTSYGSEVRLL